MPVRPIARRLGPALLAAGLLLAAHVAPAFADSGFDRWVAAFRTTALKSGVSAATYDRAFRNIQGPDPEVVEKAHAQPEFTVPMWDYFDNRVQEESVADGRAMAGKWKPWLDRIEARFGVDRTFLLAIWSMETNYGEILKNDKVMRNVVLPQALRATIPPLANVQIALAKNTSVAFIFGVFEATARMRFFLNNNVSDRIPIFLTFAACYIIIVELVSFGVNRLERRVRVAR